MINTCGLRVFLVGTEQRILGVGTPRPPVEATVYTQVCWTSFRAVDPP
jgi:hypothetical protein